MKRVEFEKQYNVTKELLVINKRRLNMIACIRFFLMLIVMVSLLWGYFSNNQGLYILAICMLCAFIYFVVYHQKMKANYEYLQVKQEVYFEHLKRIDGMWNDFKEDGSQFLEDDMERDLDLFGYHSLFQMLNITFTDRGKKRLADAFKTNKEGFHKGKQKAVQEMSMHEQFVLDIQMLGYSKRYQIDTKSLKKDLEINLNRVPVVVFLLPVVTICSLIVGFFGVYSRYAFLLCEVGFVCQLILSFVFLPKHQKVFSPLYQSGMIFQKFEKIFGRIQSEEFNDDILMQRKNLMFNECDVMKGISSLYKIVQMINQRHNIFAYILLNGFGSYDLLVRYLYINWQKKYLNAIDEWFETLSFFEEVMSLAVLKIDDFDVTLPLVEDNGVVLEFSSLKHPLICHSKAVGNDFTMKTSINIITGSNMSGKTTFMRTIGLNLILAYAGGYVFGSKMKCSFMHILTSMRVKDNVEEGISTFYGELLRIKKMIEYSQLSQPMICLIDEIFKGTNSLDRIAGAKATLQKLDLPYCLTFLTTHDFELTHTDNENISHYHFQEYYKQDKIYFDYLIKEGPSQTTNGQFLLRQLGIME